jgi:FkbH-like protein
MPESFGEPALPSTLSDIIATADRMESGLASDSPRFSIGFLRNITIEGLEPYLKHRLLSDGIRPRIVYSGYGLPRQELLQADSPLRRHKIDLLACALMLEELDPRHGFPGWTCDQVRGELEELFSELENSDFPLIALNTFLLPLDTAGPSLTGPDISAEVDKINRFVFDWVRARPGRFCLLDWNVFLRRAGEAESLDYRFWYLSRAPFRQAFLDQIAVTLRTVARSLRGLSRKCLVLDCDNTLWGGIIGEDGLDGIALDGHDYPGRAFYDFQKSILLLHERGVAITLCSKNNRDDVLEVLDRHPWCLLKREHLAGFRINWDDKAANLAALAEELNLGLDSFVFVDDNPRELALISQLLPSVTVLQTPKKRYELPGLLARSKLFENLSSASEDRLRTQSYQTESLRREEQQRHTGLQSYLASLEQTAAIHLATPGEIARVAQLCRKTNQFNLTTRRYSDYDIQGFAKADDARVYTLTAGDRFGALGLVGVLIIKREGDTATVDSLLLSCRALGRGLEFAFVIECMKEVAANWGLSRWVASYIPTAKNEQTAGFWEKMGFETIPGQAAEQCFALKAAVPTRPAPDFITIEREDKDR